MTWPIIFLLSVPNTNIQYTCSFAIHLIFKAVFMFVSPAICIFRWLKRQGWNQYDWLQALHFRISTVAFLTCLSSSAYPTYYITTVFYYVTCFLTWWPDRHACNLQWVTPGLQNHFWLVLCCVVWRQVEKNVSTLMVCLGKRQLCSTCSNSYDALKYLFGKNIFICLLSANRNSPVDL